MYYKIITSFSWNSLISWNNKLYTPIYFYIETNGNIFIPDEENLTIDFLTPEEILNKDNIANPEKEAVKIY